MDITRDMRLKAAETATPDQLWLYGSEDAAEKLYTILTKHQVTDQRQRGQCSTIVSNVVLGFHKASELPDLLGAVVTLPFRETLSLTADLLDYLELKVPTVHERGTPSLSNIPAPLPVTPPQVVVPTASIPPVSPTPPLRPLASTPSPDLKADIAEAEAALEALEPLRTMAHDMEMLKTTPAPIRPANTPPIYTSTQSALIREAEHAPIRPNDPAAGPGWSTDKS